MKSEYGVELGQRLGADRVLDPAGALPQPAERLDPSGPVRPYELELAVERLCLDSTSFRNIRQRAGGDDDLMAERFVEAVTVLEPGSRQVEVTAPRTSSTARHGGRCRTTSRWRPCSSSTTSARPAPIPTPSRPPTAPCACWAPGTPASWRSPPPALRGRAGPWSRSTSTRLLA